MTPLLYIVRHGQTDWNVEQRLQGQAEVDINDVGRQQVARNARLLATLVKDPDEFDFVSSPLRRTRVTMEHIREAFGLPRDGYRIDRRLIELHFGDWQGHTYDELEHLRPHSTRERQARKWSFVPPGDRAESYEMLAARVAEWLREVERPTICTTHGGVIRTLFHLVGGVSTSEAVTLPVPQDRVLRADGEKLEWL